MGGVAVSCWLGSGGFGGMVVEVGEMEVEVLVIVVVVVILGCWWWMRW